VIERVTFFEASHFEKKLSEEITPHVKNSIPKTILLLLEAISIKDYRYMNIALIGELLYKQSDK